MSVLTYVYALVRAPKRPQVRTAPAPVPAGEPVRLIAPAQGWWLVVSSVPAQEYVQQALEAKVQDLEWVGARAVAHEAVVEHFLSCPALLPMQLFSLFTSDQRAVEHVLQTRDRIERILARIERHVEWGVRLTWDEAAARQAAQLRHEEEAVTTGTAYLARKRDLLAGERSQWADARAAADALYGALARQASAARRHSETEEAAPQSRVVLAAAFLVRRDAGTAFKAIVQRQSRALADAGVAIALTGPWPPYNFVA